jgi:glutathione S-transferase
MLTVHHLNNSRSQRILWLLEELGLPYEIKFYSRDPVTNLAPPELKAIHPLGKSPVLADGDTIVAESAAIIDYIIRHHGSGRFAPATDSADYDRYVQWLHFAEGSAMLPLMLRLYTGRLGEAAAPLAPRIDSEIANHLSYIEGSLTGHDWLVGNDLTAADIQLSFVGEIAGVFGLRAKYPSMEGWVKRFQARPAYQRALEKGGPYAYAS